MVHNYKRKTNDPLYTEQTLQKAIEDVRNGTLSGYRASRNYQQEMKLEEMSLKPKELLLRAPSDDTCVFCGSWDKLWDLHPQGNHAQNSTHEDYSLMLLSCFNIKLVNVSGSGGLCETCVSRLRDATSFRTQVEAAGALLQQTKEESTNPLPPEHQPTIGHNPRPEQDKEIKLSNVDNLDTFWNDDSMNSHKEEDQTQNFQELKNRESLEWTDQEPLKNNLKSENKGIKRVEWIDQQQYPKPSTFRLPKLKPNSTECPVCGKVFLNRQKLRGHFEYHFPEFLCHLCGKVFAKKNTYNLHLERHTAKRFPCLRCRNKSYANKSSLRQHDMAVHDNKMVYACPKCRVRFCSGRKRKEHLLKEHGVHTNQYVCPECSQKCHTPSALDKHVRRVHRKEKNVSCPECGVFFFGKRELEMHSRSHSDVRNYICDICSKAFKARKHLRYHLAMHYDIRDHKCSLCDAAFVQWTSLKVHINSHHKNTRTPQKLGYPKKNISRSVSDVILSSSSSLRP